jgi:nucleotide-binding universal stress UspA family protein
MGAQQRSGTMTQLKVLIPLDGSKLAEASLAYLSSLRALGEVEPRLFSVVDEPEPLQALDFDEAIRREHNLLSTYLREVSADIEKHLGLVCDTRVAYGKPAQRILEAMDDFQPDLVVISTHGRSGPSRWRLGSVADKVIRGARCNVIVIGPKAAETAEWFAEISEPFKSVLPARRLRPGRGSGPGGAAVRRRLQLGAPPRPRRDSAGLRRHLRHRVRRPPAGHG